MATIIAVFWLISIAISARIARNLYVAYDVAWEWDVIDVCNIFYVLLGPLNIVYDLVMYKWNCIR